MCYCKEKNNVVCKMVFDFVWLLQIKNCNYSYIHCCVGFLSVKTAPRYVDWVFSIIISYSKYFTESIELLYIRLKWKTHPSCSER